MTINFLVLLLLTFAILHSPSFAVQIKCLNSPHLTAPPFLKKAGYWQTLKQLYPPRDYVLTDAQVLTSTTPAQDVVKNLQDLTFDIYQIRTPGEKKRQVISHLDYKVKKFTWDIAALRKALEKSKAVDSQKQTVAAALNAFEFIHQRVYTTFHRYVKTLLNSNKKLTWEQELFLYERFFILMDLDLAYELSTITEYKLRNLPEDRNHLPQDLIWNLIQIAGIQSPYLHIYQIEKKEVWAYFNRNPPEAAKLMVGFLSNETTPEEIYTRDLNFNSNRGVNVFFNFEHNMAGSILKQIREVYHGQEKPSHLPFNLKYLFTPLSFHKLNLLYQEGYLTIAYSESQLTVNHERYVSASPGAVSHDTNHVALQLGTYTFPPLTFPYSTEGDFRTPALRRNGISPEQYFSDARTAMKILNRWVQSRHTEVTDEFITETYFLFAISREFNNFPIGELKKIAEEHQEHALQKRINEIFSYLYDQNVIDHLGSDALAGLASQKAFSNFIDDAIQVIKANLHEF